MICDGCGAEAFGPCGDPTIPKGWFSKYYSYHDSVYGCSEECLTTAKEKRTVKKLLNAGPSEAGWHRLQSVLRCPRLYALTHDTPWKLSAALVKGSLVHIGLAHYYQRLKEEQEGNDPDQWHRPVEAISVMSLGEYSKDNNELWLECAELAQQAVTQYVAHWAAEQWKILAVEHELRAYVADEERNERYLYTQRADLIVANKSGKVSIIDHKTTFRIAPKTIRRYTLSGQMLGYRMFGQKMWGKNFSGVTLNMLKLPKELDGKYEFARPNVEPAPVSIPKLKQTIIYAERIIRDHQHLDPMDYPGAYHETACWTPYGQCPKFSVCQWGE